MPSKTCRFNPYVEMMFGEFSQWAFAEEAEQHRGRWRQDVFGVSAHAPLDLEIGTGNGFHFAHYAKSHPDRCLLGMELKFKTAVQSIRRCLRQGSENSRILRFDAGKVEQLFAPSEIDNVFLHFPDPWPKRRQQKNRLINEEFLKKLALIMKPGAFLEFKTDHRGYFDWAVDFFKSSDFVIQFYSEDLHNSLHQADNFITAFENIFMRKRQPIYYCRLVNQK